VLVSWGLATLHWPGPAWLGMTLLYAIAAIFIVPSLVSVRRHRNWLAGACLGFGAGVLLDQILVSLAVAVFHATHPHAGGFFVD
jgi:hypothetical protein